MQRLTVYRFFIWIILFSYFPTTVFAAKPSSHRPSHETTCQVLSPDDAKLTQTENELVRQKLKGIFVTLSILTPLITASIWCGSNAPGVAVLVSLISFNVAGAPILEPLNAWLRRYSWKAGLSQEVVSQLAQSPVWKKAAEIFMRFQAGDWIQQQGMHRYNEALILISQQLPLALPYVKATACSLEHLPDPTWMPPQADVDVASEYVATVAMLMHQNFIDVDPSYHTLVDLIHSGFTEWVSPNVRASMLPLVMERLKKRDTRLNGTAEEISTQDQDRILAEYEQMLLMWLAPNDEGVWGYTDSKRGISFVAPIDNPH